MRPGLRVRFAGKVATVIARSPKAGGWWWLGRYDEDGVWRTAEAQARQCMPVVGLAGFTGATR